MLAEKGYSMLETPPVVQKVSSVCIRSSTHTMPAADDGDYKLVITVIEDDGATKTLTYVAASPADLNGYADHARSKHYDVRLIHPD